MLINLTQKYEQLEKKMERIQNAQNNQSRRSIIQYLKKINPPKITFSKWIDTIEINKQHLKLFFDQSIVDALNQAIKDTISVGKPETIPIRNYLQKPTQVYIYDSVIDCCNVFEWRQIAAQDWKRIVSTISKKIVQLYFEWKKENQTHIESDETLYELNYGYMRKVNDVSQNIEMKIKKIKEVLIGQIQQPLIIIE
jgi:hypothetical protein